MVKKRFSEQKKKSPQLLKPDSERKTKESDGRCKCPSTSAHGSISTEQSLRLDKKHQPWIDERYKSTLPPN
ncbi:hypothetical protein F2Q69_00009850 [Brassica cretica]|uniref:Uncharacterized protein n=1 Tax=Brassica cretica TaxID=69181 RepID=A0A8S9PPK7_BRACR|nr:hypothetical protein F2Q69_00009850 [Brassica cretica]